MTNSIILFKKMFFPKELNVITFLSLFMSNQQNVILNVEGSTTRKSKHYGRKFFSAFSTVFKINLVFSIMHSDHRQIHNTIVYILYLCKIYSF